MKKACYLSFIVFLLISYPAYSQSIITFDEQGWTSDQAIDTTFTIDNYTFSSNKNIYTNYGYNFDINHISIYYAFQNPATDQLTITTLNNQPVNFTSLAAYQVSETLVDTLIIEGWEGNNKKYSTSFSDINSWTILTLEYNSINKIVIKTGNSGTGNLFDYNFDNFVFNNITGVEQELELPESYNLSQNFPNPFNPSTKISYTIPTLPVSSPFAKGKTDEGFVTLKVYDILGNEVAVLVDEQKEAGSYSVTFDAGGLASGIYIYKLMTDGFVSTKKMVLLK